MKTSLLDLTEHLVPISDFSQGKAGKIFADVAENNQEYIILKNNQPTAVLFSVSKYKAMTKNLEKFERMIETLENMRLLALAEGRVKNGAAYSASFEDLITEDGITLDELDKLAESVNIE